MARFSGATWRGLVPNCSLNGMQAYYGVVMHIMEGSLDGTDGWFHNPSAKASSHFGTGKDGRVYQWVDTVDKAWAEAAGNPYWISIENEGRSGDSLTPVQLEKCAAILAWAHTTHGVQLQVTNDPNGRGLGWHGMGGTAWGGHISCPGDPIRAQLQQIVDRAKQMVGPAPAPTPTPTGGRVVNGANRAQGGYALCGPDGGVFAYEGAPFFGSLPGQNVKPNSPIVSLAWTPTGNGYWMLGADGGVYAFGDAGFHGSYPGLPATVRNDPNRTFVAIVSRAAGGYTCISATNEHYDFA